MGSALLVGFAVFYLDICLREGNILHSWRRYLGSPNIPTKLAKPLGLCKYCMSFWASAILHIVLSPMPDLGIAVLSLGSAGIASALFMTEELFFDVAEESEE